MALVYGRNGSGKSTISNAFKKVKGEDILNIEMASLYDDSHEISIVESEIRLFLYLMKIL